MAQALRVSAPARDLTRARRRPLLQIVSTYSRWPCVRTTQRHAFAGVPAGLSSLVVASGLLLAIPAHAEPVAPASSAGSAKADAPAREVPPPPSQPPHRASMSVETPPPPPARARTYHVHDGFYLRMSLGGGYIGSTVSQSGTADTTLSGGGGAFDLMIGGTPAPGVVIGGALLGNTAPNPSYEIDGKQADVNAQLSFAVIGPFIDGFPDPKGGFHVGGTLGFAGLALEDNLLGGNQTTAFSGYGAGVWVGYAAWIAPQWSLGGMLRLTGARTMHAASGTEPKQNANARAITILFTALYH